MTSIDALIAAAAAERHAFRSNQPTDGAAQLTLVRVAVLARDDAAWAALYALYRPQLLAWTVRLLRGTVEDEAALADGAFVRFWRALTPERIAGFRDLPAVYQYLRRCVHGEVGDALRRRCDAPLPPRLAAVDADSDAAIDDATFWRTIRAHVDDDEWRVLRAKYVGGLAHRHIARRWPELYPASRDVDRVERRALSRLSRREDIRALWDER